MPRKLVFDAQEDSGEVEDLELTLNGEKHTVYKPTTGQSALMMAAFAEDVPATESAKAILDFFKNITEDDGYAAIKGILENPNIPDSLEQVMDLTEKVIETFTGNPTKQPTDYLPSRQTGGQNSTVSQRKPASRRSGSPQRGSATGSTRSSSRG